MNIHKNYVYLIRSILVTNFTRVLFIIIFLLLTEGLFSYSSFIYGIFHNGRIAEEAHTTYDSLLGWINIPNKSIKNMYGVNKSLNITNQQFRATTINPNSNTKTIICTGDSFTFGYGVDDTNTWCSLLSRGAFQTVNMGQGGYGIDQNYLWYERDAANIPHAIHIMAFVPEDFDRINYSTFYGYGKPYFQMKEDILININYPVPKPVFWQRFFIINQDNFESLRIFQVAQMVHSTFSKANKTFFNKDFLSSNSEKIIYTILQDMIKISRDRHVVPFFVLLPTQKYVSNNNQFLQYYNSKKELLSSFVSDDTIIFVDIGSSLRDIPPEQYDSFFIKPNTISYYSSEGHYTEKGNEFVANILSFQIQEYIQNHPEIIQ